MLSLNFCQNQARYAYKRYACKKKPEVGCRLSYTTVYESVARVTSVFITCCFCVYISYGL